MLQILLSFLFALTPPTPLDDDLLLARLCIVEVRGFGDSRDSACLSVIDTVYTRIRLYHQLGGEYPLSDGTVYGTLGHYSAGKYGECWQFPPWVTLGDAGVAPEARLDWVDPAWALELVARYRAGERGLCSGYIYYDSLEPGPCQCRIGPECWYNSDRWYPLPLQIWTVLPRAVILWD